MLVIQGYDSSVTFQIMRKTMTIRSTLIAALAFLFLSTGSAGAVAIDPSYVDLGATSAGDHGTFDVESTNNFSVTSTVVGTIPAHSYIYFTYLIDPAAWTAIEYAQGKYLYIGGGDESTYEGYAKATASVSPPIPPTTSSQEFGYKDGVEAPEYRFVHAFANLDSAASSGWSKIVNDSEGDVEFLSMITAYFMGLAGKITVSYAVVSTIPLPTALPMFGLALLGLAGARRFKAKAKRA